MWHNRCCSSLYSQSLFPTPALLPPPNDLNIKAYYWTEFLVTDSLYTFLILHGQWQALSFLGLQVIIFGYLGTPTINSKLRMGALFVLLIPLSNLLKHVGLPVSEMVLTAVLPGLWKNGCVLLLAISPIAQ